MSHPEPSGTPDASFRALAGLIFFRPDVAGERLATQPRARTGLAALALVMLLVALATWLVRSQLGAFALERMRENPQTPRQALEQMEGFFASPAGHAVFVVTQTLTTAIGLALIGLGLYLGQLVMGGRASFSQAFCIAALSGLISFGVWSLCRSALVLAKDSFADVSTGLGLLALERPFADPLRSALELFDVFWIWAVVSAGLALQAPARLSRALSLGVSIGLFVILGALQVAYRVFAS